MDGLIGGMISVIALLLVLGALDVLASRFGVDSRDGIGDDHRRPING